MTWSAPGIAVSTRSLSARATAILRKAGFYRPQPERLCECRRGRKYRALGRSICFSCGGKLLKEAHRKRHR